MSHSSLPLLAVLLVLPGCPDVATRGHGDRSPQPAPVRQVAVTGVYRIDAEATGKRCGLLGSLVAAAVVGSSLRLVSDGTYVGIRDGQPESKGTWKIDGERLTMRQTHELGQPVSNRGVGTIRNGALTVKTKQGGILVTLVFNRQ